MKKIIAALPAALLVALPFAASAHEHASYLIGGKQYDIVIGSLNEPLIVDDKSGLDLRVSSGGHMEMSDDGDMEPAGGAAATGLENSLKVEMIAGNAKKTFDLSPAFGTPGSYKTTFYPTVATSFSYRLFGEINKTPINLTFTCLPEGQEATDEKGKDISPGVKQLLKGGSFGCPIAKADAGFPENSTSLKDLADSANKHPVSPVTWGALALALAALAFVFVRRK